MYKTTTPTHSFTLPFTVSNIDKLMLTYKQGDKTLDFDESDVTMNNKTVSIKLTQEQTALFEGGKDVLVQMKILTTSDTVLASNMIKLKVNNVLNNTEFEI